MGVSMQFQDILTQLKQIVSVTIKNFGSNLLKNLPELHLCMVWMSLASQ